MDEIGGFQSVLFGEDTIAAAKLLHLRHSIAYVAEAEVYHSHNYSLSQEFQRHFDIGLSRKGLEKLINLAGGDRQRGGLFVRQLFKELAVKRPSLIPYALFQCAVKLIGYQLGKASSSAPLWFKKICSSQKSYWV